MKHEDSPELFNERSFDKDTIEMMVKEKPKCDNCHDIVKETFGVEEENTSYCTIELCIMCFAHRYGTENAMRLQQVADERKRKR